MANKPTISPMIGSQNILGAPTPIQKKESDEELLFSDIDPATETTEESNFERRKGNRKDWPFFCQLYNHGIKIKLISLKKNMVGKADRDGTIRDMLEDSGMVEREDWVLDNDNDFLYLKDESFLLIWKMINTSQMEKTVEYIEEHEDL